MSSTAAPLHEVSRRKQVVSDLVLIGITFIWGSTFVLVKDIIDQVSPMLFLAARFATGGLALALVMLFMGKWRGLTMRELVWGTGIGVALWAGYAFQTIGLQYTTASNAGFITGLSVVLVPVLGLFVLRHVPGRWAWAGVVCATVGLAMLSLPLEEVFAGTGALRLNDGDAIVLGCAFAFALQIVLISRVAQWCDPLRMTMVQVVTAGMMNAVSAILFEQPVVGLSGDVWAGIAFLGLVATALAIAIQVSVQRYTSAVHAALIFTLEPVFAAAFGMWLHGDRLGPVAMAGAGLILAGMLIAELGPQLRARQLARRETRSAVERAEL